MDVLDRFAEQLAGLGCDQHLVASLCGRYACALARGRSGDWERFYYDLFAAVKGLARAGSGVAREQALDAIFLIFQDDLGVQLFGEGAIDDLRRAFSTRTARAQYA
ncbi:MAG: hypothetical protein NVS9B12_07330 [Vulcanimicrobiaceae bacterium]